MEKELDINAIESISKGRKRYETSRDGIATYVRGRCFEIKRML